MRETKIDAIARLLERSDLDGLSKLDYLVRQFRFVRIPGARLRSRILRKWFLNGDRDIAKFSALHGISAETCTRWLRESESGK